MRICRECGVVNENDVGKCENCGASLYGCPELTAEEVREKQRQAMRAALRKSRVQTVCITAFCIALYVFALVRVNVSGAMQEWGGWEQFLITLAVLMFLGAHFPIGFFPHKILHWDAHVNEVLLFFRGFDAQLSPNFLRPIWLKITYWTAPAAVAGISLLLILSSYV